jgi:hypothetical protein
LGAAAILTDVRIGIALALIVILLGACELFESDLRTPEHEYDPFTGRNNSAVFSSSLSYFGNAVTDTIYLSHQITVTASGSNDFLLGPAFAMQSTSPGMYTDVIISITNNSSSKSFAFIRLNDISLKDEYGTTLHNEPYTYVRGSVGRLTNLCTDTCLAPGETGFVFVLSSSDIWSQITNVSCSVDIPNYIVQNPLPRIIPIEVDYIDEGFSDIFIVSFQNTGTETGAITPLGSTYIIFDGNNIPLTFGFGFGNLTPLTGILHPQMKGSFQSYSVITDGYGASMFVQLSYDEYDYSYSLSDKSGKSLFAANTANDREKWQTRNLRCATLEKLLNRESE